MLVHLLGFVCYMLAILCLLWCLLHSCGVSGFRRFDWVGYVYLLFTVDVCVDYFVGLLVDCVLCLRVNCA